MISKGPLVTQQVFARIGVRLLAVLALFFSLLIAPAAVAATTVSANATGGELSWGVMDRWRD